jgi:hypothetical protein
VLSLRTIESAASRQRLTTEVDEPAAIERAHPPLLDRFELKELDAHLERIRRKYDLDADAIRKLREPLARLADVKLVEFWRERTGHVVLSTLIGAAATTAICVAIGAASPPLLMVGVSTLLGLGGSLYSLYKKFGYALDGAADLELERMGKKAAGDGFLDRLARRVAQRVVDKFHKKYELEGELLDRIKKQIEQTSEVKKGELWYGRGKTEVAMAAAVPVLSAAAGALIGLLGTAALVTAGVGAIVSAGMTAYLLYKKHEYALEGSARSVIEAMRKDGDLTRPWTPRLLDNFARKKADAVVEKYVRRFGLDEAARRQLERQIDLVRASKVKELWQDRPRIAPAPLGQAAITAAILGAAHMMKPLAMISLAVGAVLSSSRELMLLEAELTHAIEGTAYAAAQRLPHRARRAALGADLHSEPLI